MQDKIRLYLLISRLLFTFIPSALLRTFRSKIHKYTYIPSLPTDPKTKNIVILGASFTGTHLASLLSHSLPSGHRILLIEKNSHFNYTFVFPRFSVLTGCEEKAFIPYDKLFSSAPKGIVKIMRGVVKSVDVKEKEVLMENGEKVSFEFLAVATGSKQGGPAMVGGVEKEEGKKELRGLQERVKQSGRIAVIGGGAVGVQIAGDVKSWYPEKEVTLVQSRERLLVGFGERLSAFVEEKLSDMGVKVICGERPVLLAGFGEEKSTTLTFKDGSSEDFDLVIPCTGQTPNSSVVSNLGLDVLANSGRISVKPTLQLSNPAQSHTFALGDVAETSGPKMARAGMMQAEIVESNILSMIDGKEATKQYVPHCVEGALKLSLGKNDSVLYVMEGPGKDILVPVKNKSEELDIERAWKHFGADTKDFSV